MNRVVPLLRLVLLGLVRGLRAALFVPARAVAAVDTFFIERLMGAAVGMLWLAVALLGYLVERYPAVLAAIGILLAVALLLIFPR